MKRVRAVTMALLFLVLGAGVQAYARQDQQDEKQTKPEKQGKPDQHPKPEAQQQQNQRRPEQAQQEHQKEQNQQQQHEQRERLSQERQQQLIQQQQERLTQYRQRLEEQQIRLQEQTQSLQQQRRMAQYRFQEEYVERLRDQDRRLRKNGTITTTMPTSTPHKFIATIAAARTTRPTSTALIYCGRR
jgi:hypothetical protein